MDRAASSPGAPPHSVVPASADEIRSHLNRILASSAFRASKRCHRFLEFVIDQLLTGNAASIKERTLAIEVFDRSSSWDSGGDDTIVRVGAREVRKRLAQYYSSPEGMQEKIRIELRLGSYVPEIVRVDYPPRRSASTLTVPAPVTVELIPPPVAAPRRPLLKWGAIAVTIAFAAAIAITAYSRLHKQTPFDQFWAPFVRSSEPVMIAVASPVVYKPTPRAYSLSDQHSGGTSLPIVKPLQVDPKKLTGSDFVPVEDQYLAFGDSVASMDVQLLLARHSHGAHVRFASRVDFAELRDAPVILVGAFTNHWTVELTQHFRFHFGFDPHWIPAILDSSNPGHYWSIPGKQDNETSPEDYFLVCRLPTSPSGTPVMIAGGVEQFGTEAAGRFIADPNRLNSVLKVFGKDWQNKNIEIVMHDKVIENTPAAPDLVGYYSW